MKFPKTIRERFPAALFQAGNWEHLIWIHERPYRIRPLQKALRRIADPKEAARLVGLVWAKT
jgi:hypothetical protein